MAFMLPIFGELVLEGVESAVAGNIVTGVYDHFEPKVKQVVTTELGNAIKDYSSKHPLGYVSKTLDVASNKDNSSGSAPKAVKKRIKHRRAHG